MASFAVMVLGLSIWAIYAIVKDDGFQRKALWIFGSLLGLVGLGINWSKPDDVILLIGFTIPPVMVFKLLPAGPVLVKTGFPVVAVRALYKVYGR
ncbi:hypothetical protein N4G62_08655 [Sphingomonas sanguinis]|uniref:Uncharacterized protein n=1 Tax=Sphingomonas sanguinis TaxID=33051 RepID=A0ABU5LQ75_9SPHN|nr:hypothetical protein [Sphingomonas sanguinis]MDZ7282094.1 hypothetical protein [Sphingomonas sanguinis]